MRLYDYVGPPDIAAAVAGVDTGVTVRHADDLVRAARAGDERQGDAIVLTFVVTSDGELRVAPRRSEHVACARGGRVLAAGELTIRLAPLEVVAASNQSTGYCPEPSSWLVARAILDGVGVVCPRAPTRACVFRRCPACGERNLVKDEWYVCDLCGEALPLAWNFGADSSAPIVVEGGVSTIAAPNLDDPKEHWLVYADALQSRGDVRGELIMLNAAVAEGGSTSERDAWLDQHARELFGKQLMEELDSVEIEWKWCVPVRVTLNVGSKHDPLPLMQALLDAPIAADLHALRVVGHTPSADPINFGAALALLAKRLSPTCTALELIDQRASRSRILVSADYDPDTNLVDFGDLDAVWAIPHLQRLHMVVADPGQVALGTIDAPELRDFSLLGLRWGEAYGGPTSMGQTLGAAKWPKLERLALRIPETFTYSWPDQDGAYVRLDRYDEENDEYYDDEGYNDGVDWAQEFEALLRNLKDTPIKHLSLTSFASCEQLLAALETHGLPPTLETLELGQSDLNDEHAAWIAARPELFGKLKLLDLSNTLIENPAALAQLGPTIVHSSGGGSIYRFSVGME